MSNKSITNKTRQSTRNRTKVSTILSSLIVLFGLGAVFFLIWDTERPPEGGDADREAIPLSLKPKISREPKQDKPPTGLSRIEKYNVVTYFMDRLQTAYADLGEKTEYEKEEIRDIIDIIAAGCVQVPDAREYVIHNGLNSDDHRIREVSLLALGATMREDVVANIVEILKTDSDPEVRGVAVAALCQARSNEERKMQYMVLDINDTIGLAGPYCSDAWERLLEVAQTEPSGKIKQQIMTLLALGIPADESDAILPVAFDKQYPASLRKAVVYKSCRIDDRHAVDLVKIVGDSGADLTLRLACLNRLEKLTISKETGEHLARILADGYNPFMMRYLCGRQMMRNGPDEFVNAYVSVLGIEGGKKGAMEALIWLASKDPQENKALKAVEFLGIVGDKDIAPELEKIIQNRTASATFAEKVRETADVLEGRN